MVIAPLKLGCIPQHYSASFYYGLPMEIKMQADKIKVKKIKVATLTGPLLNLWVALAHDEELLVPELQWDGRYWLKQGDYGSAKPCPDYSTDWSQGGPLLESNDITVERSGCAWIAKKYNPSHAFITLFATGKTYLIAAMRCFVASKFGEEVDE